MRMPGNLVDQRTEWFGDAAVIQRGPAIEGDILPSRSRIRLICTFLAFLTPTSFSATLQKRREQIFRGADRNRLWYRRLVGHGAEVYLAAELCIDEDNVADGEGHAEEPPGETDG